MSGVLPLQAPDLIKKYDEHTVAKTHKFGVIYQSFGQVRKISSMPPVTSIYG